MVNITTNTDALPRVIVDKNGNLVGPATYTLASNITLAAGASTPPVTITASGSFGWSYSFAGSSVSLKLQTLAADNTTWTDVATVTATGGQRVDIFAGSGGAPLRLTNAGTGSATALSSLVAS